MKSFLCLLTLGILASCGSSRGRVNAGQRDKIFNQVRTGARIRALEDKKDLGTGDKTELRALKNGASTQDAKMAASLAATRYSKGLSDIDNAKLKYLEQGRSEREAELRSQQDQGQILTESEKDELRKLEIPENSSANTPGNGPDLPPSQHSDDQ